MFSNINEFTIWNSLPEEIKVKDKYTPQMNYLGENRGQTERFMIVLGRLLKDTFEKIGLSFDSRNMFKVPVEFLIHLQDEFFCRYQNAVDNEDVSRNILEEIIGAWKLKSTFFMLRWIIFKVFGWEFIAINSIEERALILNSQHSTLYDGVSILDDCKILYDPDTMSSGYDSSNIVIDVKFDSEFLVKKESFERLIKYWLYNAIIVYTNTP